MTKRTIDQIAEEITDYVVEIGPVWKWHDLYSHIKNQLIEGRDLELRMFQLLCTFKENTGECIADHPAWVKEIEEIVSAEIGE